MSLNRTALCQRMMVSKSDSKGELSVRRDIRPKDTKMELDEPEQELELYQKNTGDIN